MTETNMFRKSHYVWLASVCRDMLNGHLAVVDGIETAIDVLADALEDESPHRFNKTMFLHNVFCDPTNPHELMRCPYHSK